MSKLATLFLNGERTRYEAMFEPDENPHTGVLTASWLRHVYYGAINRVVIDDLEFSVKSLERLQISGAIRVVLEPLPPNLSTLADELVYARTKFPSNQYLFEALAEEIGEMADAFRTLGDTVEARKEALQVACVAMRIATEGPDRTGEHPDTLNRMADLETFAREFFTSLKHRPDLSARS